MTDYKPPSIASLTYTYNPATQKVVPKDAVVLDLDSAYGCWAEERNPALIVGRLRETRSVAAHAIADQIEAQIRPAIEEPKGLGAVVEDASGAKWVRLDHDVAPWAKADGGRFPTYWPRIEAVRVLSEGVQS